jgi:hypothetical protein
VVRGGCNIHDVRLSIPGLPGIKTDHARIQTSKNTQIEKIEKYFPLEQWTEAYAHNKWRSFVYAPREHATHVRDAAIAVLKEQLKLDINAESSNASCHL